MKRRKERILTLCAILPLSDFIGSVLPWTVSWYSGEWSSTYSPFPLKVYLEPSNVMKWGSPSTEAARNFSFKKPRNKEGEKQRDGKCEYDVIHDESVFLTCFRRLVCPAVAGGTVCEIIVAVIWPQAAVVERDHVVFPVGESWHFGGLFVRWWPPVVPSVRGTSTDRVASKNLSSSFVITTLLTCCVLRTAREEENRKLLFGCFIDRTLCVCSVRMWLCVTCPECLWRSAQLPGGKYTHCLSQCHSRSLSEKIQTIRQYLVFSLLTSQQVHFHTHESTKVISLFYILPSFKPDTWYSVVFLYSIVLWIKYVVYSVVFVFSIVCIV